MRLIHSGTLKLEEFDSSGIQEYAILSHTWGNGEISLQEMQTDTGRKKNGFKKVQDCAEQARKDKLNYIWIDTCCIDKTSSVELSEAINSMYQWYKRSRICYAYLPDVRDPLEHESENLYFGRSKWLTRGWTLQELIAPKQVEFYGEGWKPLGSKSEYAEIISKFTRIDLKILCGADLEKASVAQRMSWASDRQTTRIEDRAYCLMGLFDVNMPLLYGEGDKAFIRLQQEIMKDSDDHSLFAWKDRDASPGSYSGLLAHSITCFKDSGRFIPHQNFTRLSPYSITNKGLSLQLLLANGKQDVPIEDEQEFYAALDCIDDSSDMQPLIRLKCLSAKGNQFTRINTKVLKIARNRELERFTLTQINVRQKPLFSQPLSPEKVHGYRLVYHNLFEKSAGDYYFSGYLSTPTAHGKLGALYCERKTDGDTFAVILGVDTSHGARFEIVRSVVSSELKQVYDRCTFSSLSHCGLSKQIEFPEHEPGAIKIEKGEEYGKAMLSVQLIARFDSGLVFVS